MFYAQKSDKYKFIMCTNSRCGSTLMKRWMLKIHDCEMPDEGDFVSPHNAGVQFEISRSELDDSPYFKFLVVRNPWERLVSFYKVWVVVNEQHYEQGLTRSSSFSDLISTLEERPPLDPRTAVQIHGLEGVKFDKIVYLENLDNDMAEVVKRCGISGVNTFSSKVFPSPSNEAKLNRPASEVSGKYFVTADQWPKWQDFYNPKIAQRVAEIYSDDVKAFGYRWNGADKVVSILHAAKEASEKRGKGKRRNRI